MIVITPPARSAVGRGNVVDSGEPIRVIARDPFSRPSQSRERVEVVQGSPGDAAIVAHAFTRGDSVCRLAAPVPDTESAQPVYVDFTRSPTRRDSEKGHR
jgi:hypothetical protein